MCQGVSHGLKCTEFSFPPLSQKRIGFPAHRWIHPCSQTAGRPSMFISLSLLPEMGSAVRDRGSCYVREPGTVTNLLNDLNWHSLIELRRKIARLTTMYKILNNKIALNIPEYIAHPMRVTRSYSSTLAVTVAPTSTTSSVYQNLKRMEHSTFSFIRSAICGRFQICYDEVF